MQSKNPIFPCWCVKFNEEIEKPADLINQFTQIRPNSNWVILGEGVAASEKQLWSAWISLGRRVSNNNMISKKEDVEFLRLIAGTHQIRSALEKTGVRVSDSIAWIVYLPKWSETHIDSPLLADIDWNLREKEVQKIMLQLGVKPKQMRPHPTHLVLERLGIRTPEIPSAENIELELLSHIACADLNIN